MAATVRELAELVRGRVVGDGELPITAARPVMEAGPGDITFLDDDRFLAALRASPASAVLIGSTFALPDGAELPASKAFVVVDDPRAAFILLRDRLRGAVEARRVEIHPTAVISPTASIGKDVSIGAYATIDDLAEIGDGATIHAGVRIGPRTKVGREVTLHANVVLYEDVQIGDRTILHAGVIVGADGFGYQMVDGRHAKVAQSGGVVIEEDIEVGAGSCIDRGTYGPTRIGAGTKIDNLVQVGHNVRIGRHNILCALVGVGGSVTTGDYVIMGGQVGIKDHMTVGQGARLSAQAGVNRDVPAGVTVFGTPAVPLRRQLEMHSLTMRLPEMRRQLKALAQEVRRIDEAIAAAQPGRDEAGGGASNAA